MSKLNNPNVQRPSRLTGKKRKNRNTERKTLFEKNCDINPRGKVQTLPWSGISDISFVTNDTLKRTREKSRDFITHQTLLLFPIETSIVVSI